MVSKERSSGFTLVETMVVVLILAVLVAIAVPSYLGFRNQSNDSKAKLHLNQTAKAEMGLYVQDGVYTTNAATLSAMIADLDIGGPAEDSIKVVLGDVVPGDASQVLVYVRSRSDTWFGLRLVAVGADTGLHTCSGSLEADMTLALCSGTDW